MLPDYSTIQRVNTGLDKYYVTCGDIKAVVLASSVLEACYKALMVVENRKKLGAEGESFGIRLDEFFFVDKRGFKETDAKVWLPMDDFIFALKVGEI